MEIKVQIHIHVYFFLALAQQLLRQHNPEQLNCTKNFPDYRPSGREGEGRGCLCCT